MGHDGNDDSRDAGQHLQRVDEHMEVFASDGEKIGTVDKVRGDRIILTKRDPEAGGHHHSIPSSWIASVDGKVMLSKSATEAKTAWRDEERDTKLSDDDVGSTKDSDGPHVLNKAFSGTY